MVVCVCVYGGWDSSEGPSTVPLGKFITLEKQALCAQCNSAWAKMGVTEKRVSHYLDVSIYGKQNYLGQNKVLELHH